MRKIAAIAALGLALALPACANADNVAKMSCKDFVTKIQNDPDSMERDGDAFINSLGVNSEAEAQERVLKLLGFCIDPANADKTVQEAADATK